MSTPQRFLIRVGIFLLLALIVVVVLHRNAIQAFLNNPALNSLILGVLVIGIVYNIRRILQLSPELAWLEAYQTGVVGRSVQDAPRLVAPLAAVLSDERRGRGQLSALSTRHVLDSVAARLDESRDIARYLTGLLIFLGLLGTFYGLVETMSSVGTVIGGLSLRGGDVASMFEEMKSGLAAPLGGMGTAFSASLFGLAGSLVLGFLDLQASQAQNNFYNDLEDWLAGQTRFSFASEPADMAMAQPHAAHAAVVSAPSLPAYVQALLRHTAENLDRLQEVVQRSGDDRQTMNKQLGLLNERLAMLGDRLQREQELMVRLAEGQIALTQEIGRRTEAIAPGLDEATRAHIRNTDAQLGQLLEELARGREEMTRELRSEIKLVSRTIAIAAGEPEAVPYEPARR